MLTPLMSAGVKLLLNGGSSCSSPPALPVGLAAIREQQGQPVSFTSRWMDRLRPRLNSHIMTVMRKLKSHSTCSVQVAANLFTVGTQAAISNWNKKSTRPCPAVLYPIGLFGHG